MRRLVTRFAAVLFVTLIALAQVGCTTARHIRSAQNTFNEAARAENELRVHTFAGGSPTLDASSAASSYRIALDLLNTELRENEQALREEQLLGTALVLKALCLWRLADLEEYQLEAAANDGSATLGDTRNELNATVEVIERAQQAGEVTLGTRDRVMVKALSGLRDHDRGLRAENLKDASANFESAYVVLDRSLQQVDPPPNHPVRIYVRLAQLSSLRAYQAGVYRFEPHDREERRKMVKKIHDCAKVVVLRLKPVARNDAKLKEFIQTMNDAIGISSIDSIDAVDGVPTCSFTTSTS